MGGGDVILSCSRGGEMAEGPTTTMARELQQQPPLPLSNNHSNRPCSSATNSSSNTPRNGANLPKLDTSDEFPVGMRVLVVDDDPICLMVLERMLHRCSYRGILSLCYRSCNWSIMQKTGQDYCSLKDSFRLLCI